MKTNLISVANDVWISKSRFFLTSMEACRDSLIDMLKKINTIPEVLKNFKEDISGKSYVLFISFKWFAPNLQ